MLAFLGFLFISVFGTINHFLYDLLGRNKYAAYFFAVNESTWEHMKLVVFPSIIWLFISFFISDNPNVFVGNYISLVVMLVLIPFLFYLLNFIFGKTSSLINILIFYISVFVGSIVNGYILNLSALPRIYNIVGVAVYFFVIVMFLIFSKDPGDSILFDVPNK